MFGFLRPCRHHLGPELYARWSAHLCGLCLTLRDDAGQLARATTHVDALVVSVLAEAQGVGDHRRAGPCPLRGMRPATVVTGDGARLAASTALLLAADRVDDHVADADGPFGGRAGAPARAVGSRVAAGWARAGTSTAAAVGFDPVELLAVPARQHGVETGDAAQRSSTSGGAGIATLAAATAPTEAAVGSALAHTAALAGRPDNAEPLDEAGRLLGRLAHLLDAVEDRDADAATGRWNPLAATATSTPDALDRCRAAVDGIRGALRRVTFSPAGSSAGALAHRLLVHESARAVERAAVASGGSGDGDGGSEHHGVAIPGGPVPRGLAAGCAAAVGLCCTGKLCCADEFEGPWSREQRENACKDCLPTSCDCCSCCGDGDECCSCCDCCGT